MPEWVLAENFHDFISKLGDAPIFVLHTDSSCAKIRMLMSEPETRPGRRVFYSFRPNYSFDCVSGVVSEPPPP